MYSVKLRNKEGKMNLFIEITYIIESNDAQGHVCRLVSFLLFDERNFGHLVRNLRNSPNSYSLHSLLCQSAKALTHPFRIMLIS